jgi:hypothetical protein
MVRVMLLVRTHLVTRTCWRLSVAAAVLLSGCSDAGTQSGKPATEDAAAGGRGGSDARPTDGAGGGTGGGAGEGTAGAGGGGAAGTTDGGAAADSGWSAADAGGRDGPPAADLAGDRGALTTFIHPGLLHTREDLDRMKARVASGTQPQLDGYNLFRAHAQSSSTYTVRGGFAEMGRNPDVRKTETEQDANAAYQNALMWAITGNQAHASKAIQILNTWSANLTTISGSDAILAAGIYGFKLVSAAEILRHTGAGWLPADVARAEGLFRNVYYPVIRDFATFANGNWSLACVMTMMAIGVFSDDRAMFDRAVSWYQNGSDNGSLTHYVINQAGQCQESGRDQAHAQLGLGYLAQSAEIAWNQGMDLYGAVDNRLLRGFEYTASYNLGNDVPFQAYTDTTGKYRHTTISDLERGSFRPIYEMVYNHYRVRRGLACPYTEAVAQRLRPEGAAFQADHPGFGTLLFSR